MSDEAAQLASLEFDHRGHRVGGEIDIENRKLPKTIADMTDEDWSEAAEMVRRWDAGWRP